MLEPLIITQLMKSVSQPARTHIFSCFEHLIPLVLRSDETYAFNVFQLYINTEMCVNTLMYECTTFLVQHRSGVKLEIYILRNILMFLS